jgi:hypothetical protein
VFIATTVMLSFISFWRAAAIVLADLASSAYYAGGDSEKVIGKSAPWFILAVMLFSYAVRAVYIEASSMLERSCQCGFHQSPGFGGCSWAAKHSEPNRGKYRQSRVLDLTDPHTPDCFW